MERYIVESRTDPDTKVIRFVVVDRVAEIDFDARDFGYEEADWPTERLAEAFAGVVRADMAEFDPPSCEGHPAGPYDPMGVTVFCDGTCAS
jgi:hypothetical protein